MAATYDIQTYLLDRANIHDSVSKMYLAYDERSFDTLLTDVFTPKVDIDYTKLLGGEPMHLPAEEWVQSVKAMVEGLDSTQHILTSLVFDLPQPGGRSARPDVCNVTGNAVAHMVRKAAKGGPNMHDGGLAYFTVTRMKGLEDQGKNPWRVSKMAFVPAWTEGNWGVMEAFSGIGK